LGFIPSEKVKKKVALKKKDGRKNLLEAILSIYLCIKKEYYII